MSSNANTYFIIRINRNVSIAVVASLLAHILALYLLSHFDLLKPHPPTTEQGQTLNIELVSPSVEPTQQSPEKPKKRARQKSEKQAKKSLPTPAPHKEILPIQAPPQPSTPTQQATLPKTVAPTTEKYADLDSYMKAAKERRRLAGDPSAINEEESANERKLANIKHTPQPSGTNGIFNILKLNTQSATFDFRGWKNEFSYVRREVYDVEADRNTDIYRAVVRKMIEIIRLYYSGDFNWDSPRLGQVVVLSARTQDNAFLENFMLQEFFGARGVSAQ